MRFFYVRLRTCAQYVSMNEFTCSEHSVRIRTLKKRITGKQPLHSTANHEDELRREQTITYNTPARMTIVRKKWYREVSCKWIVCI